MFLTFTSVTDLLPFLAWLGALVAALALLVKGVRTLSLRFERAARRRRFRDLPRRSVDDCRDGEIVRLVGQVVLVDPALSAPSDGVACVYYTSAFGRPYEERTYSSEFWLSVDGGWAWVCPHEADAGLERRTVTLTPGTAPPAIRAELDAVTSDDLVRPSSDRVMTYVEHRLPVGVQVAVVGCARWIEATGEMSSAYRGGVVPRRVLSIIAPSGGALQMSVDAEAAA